MDYSKSYVEFETIGRGNFGTAYLVRSKSDQKVYVAKKILLDAMKDKERDDALRESSLLKKLDHPNIVSYRDSFSESGTLIIVMEYCEEGDLSFHIKRKKQKQEYFPQSLILHWFLQSAFALKYIHENRILHRDIKSSNIFLTSNGFVKIGDFGISRVLEHTYDAANTVVGTPYYMSPEVCENKPYTLKSDVWALGCVLYELCTLKHAFESNNLLGLVYKIVKDEAPDIPNHYSTDLKNLVKSLLCKDDRLRPSIKEIFELEWIRKEMECFIKSDGNEIRPKTIPIRKTQTHQEIEQMLSNESMKEGTLPTMKSDYMNTQNSNTLQTVQSLNISNLSQGDGLTPQQRLKLKKEQEAQRQRELMASAARENAVNNKQSQQRRLNDLAGSNSAPLKNSGLQQTQQPKSMTNTMAAYEITVKSEMAITNKSHSTKDFDLDGTVESKMEQTLHSESVFINQDQQNHYLDFNRLKITDSQLDRYSNVKQKQWEEYGTIQTQIDNKLSATQQYADEEFEEYNSDDEKDQPRLTEEAGEQEIKRVMAIYKAQLSQTQQISPQKKQPILNFSEIKETSIENYSSSSSLKRDDIPVKDARLLNLRKNAINKFGSDQYNKLYSYLSHHRSKGTTEDVLRKSLVEMLGKEKINDCLIIDEIIFLETMKSDKK